MPEDQVILVVIVDQQVPSTLSSGSKKKGFFQKAWRMKFCYKETFVNGSCFEKWYIRPAIIDPSVGKGKAPIDYFKLFFDKELVSPIFSETKKYTLQKDSNIKFALDVEDLIKTIAILFLSWYNTLSSKCTGSSMRWFKTRPIIKILNENFLLYGCQRSLRLSALAHLAELCVIRNRKQHAAT